MSQRHSAELSDNKDRQDDGSTALIVYERLGAQRIRGCAQAPTCCSTAAPRCQQLGQHQRALGPDQGGADAGVQERH